MVGTVDYIAPEVFSKEGYTETVDWWSLGTILFEMLLGYPPFYGNEPSKTLKHVMNFKEHLKIPKDSKLSSEAVDLLRQLISDGNCRLGRNGVDEIKSHPFFRGVDWSSIRENPAPLIPRLNGPADTSNFEKFNEVTPWGAEPADSRSRQRAKEKDYYWIGYTYKKPRAMDHRQEIEQIFEKLRKKKEHEYKRQFSEERVDSRFLDSRVNQNSSNMLSNDQHGRPQNFIKKSTHGNYEDGADAFAFELQDKQFFSTAEVEYSSNNFGSRGQDRPLFQASNLPSRLFDKVSSQTGSRMKPDQPIGTRLQISKPSESSLQKRTDVQRQKVLGLAVFKPPLTAGPKPIVSKYVNPDSQLKSRPTAPKLPAPDRHGKTSAFPMKLGIEAIFRKPNNTPI